MTTWSRIVEGPNTVSCTQLLMNGWLKGGDRGVLKRNVEIRNIYDLIGLKPLVMGADFQISFLYTYVC